MHASTKGSFTGYNEALCCRVNRINFPPKIMSRASPGRHLVFCGPENNQTAPSRLSVTPATNHGVPQNETAANRHVHGACAGKERQKHQKMSSSPHAILIRVNSATKRGTMSR